MLPLADAGIYVLGYVILFCWFAWSLRTVVDGFKIKAELKFTSCIGISAVLPWFIFNNIYKTVGCMDPVIVLSSAHDLNCARSSIQRCFRCQLCS